MPATSRAAGVHRVDVLGVGISTVDPQLALDELAQWIERREPHYVCVTGVHGVMESQRDPELRAIHNRSGLTVPDGMPMVWACHHAGAEWVSRVYGPDLMKAACARGAAEGWRMFLYGGTSEALNRLEQHLHQTYPGIRIVGRISPPFRPLTSDEQEQVVEEINASHADIVWVGLSTPKQEHWMAEFRPRLSAPVLVGVGAAFDLVPGTKRQAPQWMQQHGIEWLFRLMVEPRRLWKRYLRNNPAFVAAVLRRPPRLMDLPTAAAGPSSTGNNRGKSAPQ